MSPFLDNVRLIKVVSATGPSSTASPQESDSEGVSVHVSKHSNNDGSEWIAIPLAAIVFTFIYLIVKTVVGSSRQWNRTAGQPPARGGGLTQEEVEVLQKIQRTLSQMESRVEALETILIEEARTEKKYGSKL